MKVNFILEVCAFNVESCIIAERAGAYRVELCDNPVEGGTTPSYGAIKLAREKISIKLYPIIRPKSGNYFYDDTEFEVLKKDVEMCREVGCDGISVGVQNSKAEIDIERMKRIVELAYPMGVTCNRAFDAVPDCFKALEDLIACGCERILTSGQESAAPDAGKILGKLVKQAGNRISIMPGAGVRSSNIAQLIGESGAKEYHTSARKLVPNPLPFHNSKVLDAGSVYLADEEELRRIIEIFGSIK